MGLDRVTILLSAGGGGSRAGNSLFCSFALRSFALVALLKRTTRVTRVLHTSLFKLRATRVNITLVALFKNGSKSLLSLFI